MFTINIIIIIACAISLFAVFYIDQKSYLNKKK